MLSIVDRKDKLEEQYDFFQSSFSATIFFDFVNDLLDVLLIVRLTCDQSLQIVIEIHCYKVISFY